MVQANRWMVHDSDGVVGTVDAGEFVASRPDGRIIILTHGGQELRVPVAALSDAGDGVLMLDRAQVATHSNADEHVIPLIEESAAVTKREVPVARTRVEKHVHTETLHVNEPLAHDTLRIERVPINRVIDKSPGMRVDGETTIIPVLEERLVKVLILKEELHVTRVREQRRQPLDVTLRREEAVIDRRPIDAAASANADESQTI